MTRALFATAVALALVGCAGSQPAGSDQTPVEAPTPRPDRGEAPAPLEARRAFSPRVDGRAVQAGISYGPYREGQRPGGPDPTPAQILEDLNLIAPRWSMIRIYSSRGPAEAILRQIRDEGLPLLVVVGAWIAPDDPEANRAEVEAAIRLAQAYPEQVAAVSVGNETQVAWSGHRSSPEALVGYIRQVRAAVDQPVTTADDYNFWNKPESKAVADEVDFILLHAYAMWNKQTLEGAVAWTARTVDAIAEAHPGHQIVLGETGWATALNPEGDEVKYIKAEAGEQEQATFFTAFTAWAAEAGLSYFYFEAFDEPWKGSADPREVEKHWGLYNVDRTPKAALSGGAP